MSTELSLHELFKNQMPDMTRRIEDLHEQVAAEGIRNSSGAELYHIVHKLVGSSGLLGYQQISLHARMLEDLLDPENEDNEVEDNLAAVSESIQQLLAAMQSDESNLNENLRPTGRSQAANLDRASKLIYLFEDDRIQAADMATQIEYYGYRVKVFDRLANLKDAVTAKMPAGILMSIAFPEGRMAGPKAIRALREEIKLDIPVIFLSTSDHFSSRLQAVRAGGQAYFLKPVDIISLIDALDRLTQRDNQEPYRILLIEDSKFQAAYYAQILENEGMQTQILTQPLKVLDVMAEFNPDLILLDVYMPECSGMELANLVRQVERFVSIPIVYLSAERDIEVQLRAMSQGGDDFLAKPIKAEHLIAAVRARVIRYRKLRSLMLRDGLTGLLNHTTINEYLEQELARAQRQRSTLSFVMIDLDYFKRVNDSYGHPTGDRVLKSLARLLKQRLRRADVVGRYGGEEFALILPDTSAENARYVMEDIRRRFQKIYHLAGDQHFTVTFSCGIAAYPDYCSAADLKEAADHALYEAKRKGRDQASILRPLYYQPCEE